MSEEFIRHEIVRLSKSLFERGLTSGSSGNISARVKDGFIVTPTNSCLGFLEAARLTKLDLQGCYISGDKPTKELPLHLSVYQARPSALAIVHTHSTYSTLLSCRTDINMDDAVPPLTPYVVMRVGKVPVIPYFKPGSDAIIPHILTKAPSHAAFLIANHGPVVAGADLASAFYILEELEETCKLLHFSKDHYIRYLTEAQVKELS